MISLKKALILLSLLTVCTDATGNPEINNKRTLSLYNTKIVPELRAKTDDGGLLIMHLNPSFCLVEYKEEKEFRKTIVSEGHIEINCQGRVDKYKLAETKSGVKEGK